MPRPPRRPMSAGRGRGSTNGNARGEEGREAPPSRKRQERRSTAKWARLSAPTNRNSQRGAARQSERGGRGLRAVSSALVRTPQRESRFEPPHHGQPIGRRLAPPPAAPPPPLLPVPPPGFGGIPPPGLGVTPGPNQRGAETGGDPLPNPGAFEECHRKCKELFPVQMEGVKLTVNKGLSNHFQVNHTVALSTLGESNYHFGATYVGTKQLSPTEAFPVLVGDMDNSGSLNAQIIHQLTARLRSKVAFQTQGSKFINWQLDGEYRGGGLHGGRDLGEPRHPAGLRDPGGPLSAERHPQFGAGGGAGLSPAPRGGGDGPVAGGAIHSTQLDRDPDAGPGGSSRHLLPSR
ncbi:hypothetical protein Q9966_010019 [Columba livia]|nr:hypothetical protein Q9966_010019 [Columba livia]